MKQLNLQIKNCGDCPFCKYDHYYDMQTNSGFNCEHDQIGIKRILTDEKGLFTVGIISNHPIPDWCPLDDVEK